MSARRAAALAAAALVLAATLVPIGRWEDRRQTDSQLHGLARVSTAVGSLDSPTLSAYRFSSTYDCFDYRRGARTFALELCFDTPGYRLLEASDRLGGTVHVYSLRLDPGAASIVLPRAQVRATLEQIRRGTVASIWKGPSGVLATCARASADILPSDDVWRTLAGQDAVVCQRLLPNVFNDANSAKVAGSAAVYDAALGIAGVVRGYIAAYERLVRSLNTRSAITVAFRDFARTTKVLSKRVEAIVRRLRKREPWLFQLAP